MKKKQEVIEIKIPIQLNDVKNIMEDNEIKPTKNNVSIFIDKCLPDIVETLKGDAFEHIDYEIREYLKAIVRGN